MSDHSKTKQIPIIRRLNDSVKAKIHSSTSVSSICCCVRELVYNSLDAGATHITVKLDIVKYFVQVTDNGCGINHNDLIVLGGKNFTSKCHSVQELQSVRSMGFKGEALCSMCELSGTMEVCSRHQLSPETWCKLFHHCRDLGVTRSTAHCQVAGTTVTLHDIFYSMPVRRKCIKENLEMEYIRQMVQHTAIVKPHVAFVVENSTTGTCILHSKKGQSSMEKLSQFYSPSVTKTMLPVEYCTGSYNLNGYISTEMYPSKSLQLVYVNNRLVSQTQVHTLLNTLLTNKHKSCEHGHPVYFVTIQCPPSECDFCWQPCKTLVEFVDWTAVLQATGLAAKTATSRLRCPETTQNVTGSCTVDTCPEDESTSVHFSHGMQSDIVRRNRKSSTTTMTSLTHDSKGDAVAGDLLVTPKFISVKASSRSPLRTPSIAQKLAQFSNGRMEQGPKVLSKKRINPHLICSKLAKHFVPDMLDSPFVPQHHSTPLQDVQDIDTHQSSCRPEVPVTKSTSDMLKSEDDSVGFCSRPFLAAPHLTHSTSPFVSHGTRISFSLKSQSYQAQDKCSKDVKPIIIEKLISEWSNPVFKTGQEHILTASTCGSDTISIHNMIHSYRFTKDMFHRIKVINQVDNKFIACLMDTKSNGSYNLLVLVDQHAAHERIRLEKLIAELYDEEAYSGNVSGRQVLSSPIEPPLKFQLESQQLQLATTIFSKQLHAVGIELSQINNVMLVHKLPSVLVNKKCPTISTTTIKEMVREHVEHLMTTGGSSCIIPLVLTDLLATQACHGAIKFNDPLTLNECHKLIESLSHCKLPFQCAHGRPSLVPVLDLGLLNKNRTSPKIICTNQHDWNGK
ncbi:DNA mismatch repair protein Mlh3-like isoform X2 [Dysidea avara]|uniref:DNA mismatch repair protein Mlh3-like isoform X2 n=1 Tax=Dysidea avara TaxID=196820 RepID=UPI00331A440B